MGRFGFIADILRCSPAYESTTGKFSIIMEYFYGYVYIYTHTGPDLTGSYFYLSINATAMATSKRILDSGITAHLYECIL